MARNQFPMMRSGGGIVSKLVGLGVLAAVLTLIVKYPGDAAGWLSGGLDAAGDVIDGIVNFLRVAFGG